MSETSSEKIKRMHKEYSSRLEYSLSLEKDKLKNMHGDQTCSVLMLMYMGGVSSWYVDKNLDIFTERAYAGLSRLLGLFERAKNGEDIYAVSNWQSHHEFLSLALSLNSVGNASKLAECCREGRIENEPDLSELSYKWTLALKYLILDQVEKGKYYLSELASECSNKSNRKYLGYVQAMDAIWCRDEVALLKALENINEYYPKQIDLNETFYRIEQHFFSQYGIALVYLARSKGMEVNYKNTFFS